MAKDNLWLPNNAFNGPAVSSSRGSQYQSGGGGENSSDQFFTNEWQRRFRDLSILLDQNAKDIEALTGIQGLPFAGVLGDGRNGPLQISSNTTATRNPPIYQLTRLTVDSGITWTAEAGNPGGFLIACQGLVTIDGTITLNGRGGQGAAAVMGGNAVGFSGAAGHGFAGAGGGGGESGGFAGGAGGLLLQFPGPAGTDDVLDTTSEWKSPTDHARVLPYIIGSTGAKGSGAGDAGSALSSNTINYFDVMWNFYRTLLWGWGAGGGGGAANDGTGGVGGTGGGFFVILCDSLDFTGTINANGVEGGDPSGGTDNSGGGGGGGGGVLLGYRKLIANTGTINVNGGAAGAAGGVGDAGGAGAAGYSNVFAMNI